MKIYIGADHRGFHLKQAITGWLVAQGYDVTDCGNTVLDQNDDYPDYVFKVADIVTRNPEVLGIVICGSGGGATIAANKVKGIRCTQAASLKDVIHNRDHNNINMLAIGADHTADDLIIPMVSAFVTTPYVNQEERFRRRLAKIAAREN